MHDCKPISTPMEANHKLTSFGDEDAANETLFRQLIGSLIYMTIICLGILMQLV